MYSTDVHEIIFKTGFCSDIAWNGNGLNWDRLSWSHTNYLIIVNCVTTKSKAKKVLVRFWLLK